MILGSSDTRAKECGILALWEMWEEQLSALVIGKALVQVSALGRLLLAARPAFHWVVSPAGLAASVVLLALVPRQGGTALPAAFVSVGELATSLSLCPLRLWMKTRRCVPPPLPPPPLHPRLGKIWTLAKAVDSGLSDLNIARVVRCLQIVIWTSATECAYRSKHFGSPLPSPPTQCPQAARPLNYTAPNQSVHLADRTDSRPPSPTRQPHLSGPFPPPLYTSPTASQSPHVLPHKHNAAASTPPHPAYSPPRVRSPTKAARYPRARACTPGGGV
ncbi:uncharacterized protein EV422DRAFT_243260 [Fimicolochytrium jonesii]|uniref:uncharacterized protein n=1 Tax=Fimicolochytrium jonesii TaxID=1396493 RepID=UPI0022FDCB7F|nr:uncharacterized protein EV422DRAFT_243260 [Fimicolochytrium jonesii]KAI8825045.1 hypothetical protein EV422DRAFT_243260 [Fimicolochytrium jonesii]